MSRLIECNFDGIVGPTHHFGGLGVGNVASLSHAGQVSHPRAAALCGLAKVAAVMELADPASMRAALLPPQPRPDLNWLASLGFRGTAAEILAEAAETAPHILAAAWSASAMWTANAATVAPAADTLDGNTHFTISNLSSSPHRSLEPSRTEAVFSQIFSADQDYLVHAPLPGGFAFRDEGAANHMRLSAPTGAGGHHLFVHGGGAATGGRFIARQSLDAVAAIARRHRLPQSRTYLLRQHPAAIDAGAFHNDVVATSHANILLYHEFAFLDADQELARLQRQFTAEHGQPLVLIRIPAARLSLSAAMESYLFNSQLIPNSLGQLTLVSPLQCQELAVAEQVIDWLLTTENPIHDVRFVDLRESMSNGGGPACLRLRVPLTSDQLTRLPAGVFWTPQRGERLRRLISSSYRAEVTAADLRDSEFAKEALEVVREIHHELGLELD
ncbi:N-succinylarginine dihydrolase [Planctomycetaceae bacterium SH139]